MPCARSLIAGDGRFGRIAQARGLAQVARDAALAVVQHLGHPRQGQARHDQIKQPEADREPDELRREIGDIQLRHARPLSCSGQL
jgi:hypothetical protein